MTAFLDTNVLIRHLTGDPPGQAARATRLLSRAGQLRLPDLIVAEVVNVLESFYEVPRPRWPSWCAPSSPSRPAIERVPTVRRVEP